MNYPRTTTVLALYGELIQNSTGKFDNTATIAVSLLDSASTLITGSNITLTAAGWGGNYEGSIPSTVTLTAGATGYLLYTVTGTDSAVRTRKIPVTFVDDSTIGQGVIVLSAPQNKVQQVIVKGNSYLNADQTALYFSRLEGELAWPDTLSGWTIALTLTYKSDYLETGGTGTTTTLAAAGVVVKATGYFQAVYVELTAAVTALLYSGTGVYTYTLTATSGTTVNALAQGTVTVRAAT